MGTVSHDFCCNNYYFKQRKSVSMAGPPKKKAIPNPETPDSGSDSDGDSDSYHGQEVLHLFEIQADFEGRNPDVQDFHGIKQLLQQLFLKAHVNLSEMSDLLIAQTGVGSVLKQSSYDENDDDDDDDSMTDALDVFGITTVLNLSNKKAKCVQEFIDLLKDYSEQHATPEVRPELANLLSSGKKLGLLINERFVNIPPKISDPLFASLMGELDRIKGKNESYDFEYYVMICKMHKPKGSNSTNDVIFANAEEEIFDKESHINFEFNVQNECDTTVAGKWTEGDVELVPYRRVLIIKANKLASIVQKVKVFVN